MTSPLSEIIKKRIATDGAITVADYMSMALGHPEHGYYMGRDPFGADGDFITAPEISQMFGELLGLWTAVVWGQMGQPPSIRLVEIGPGRGTLMSDMLRAAAAVPPFHAAIDVHLVETSPTLRRKQKETLGRSDIEASWYDTPDDIPDGPLIVIANEFFDALPVRQFVKQPDGWHERMVGLGPDGALEFGLSVETGTGEAMVSPTLSMAPDGAVAEVCPIGSAIAKALAERVTRFGGAALVIDYGHEETAAGETLQAVRDHQYHPVLEAPGEADLTTHVDFEALAQSVRQAGARADGPVTQGTLLSRLGIEARAEALMNGATAEQAEDIRAAMARLTDDDQMGTLFKAMAIVHPRQPVAPGFE
ncbi:MAG: class I SAM-dependent methyltransferase [Rhodospirillales bacterium]|nr:class I SAM-dependent methyltransferase [Rhodospirillales bacterium]